MTPMRLAIAIIAAELALAGSFAVAGATGMMRHDAVITATSEISETVR